MSFDLRHILNFNFGGYMKSSLLIKALALFIIILSVTYPGFSQKEKYPNEVFGLGVSLGSMGNYGVVGVYAIDPDIHLGLNFGFYLETGSGVLKTNTYMEFLPHIKYYIAEPIRSLRPFALGGLRVSTRPESYKDEFDVDQTRIVTSTGFAIYAGGEWQAISSVSIFAGLQVITLDIDPTIFRFGVGPAFFGIMFYL